MEEFKMGMSYETIIIDNLSGFFAQIPHDVEKSLGAEIKGDRFYFRAFGNDCCVGPDRITLSGKPAMDPRGIIISLYLVHANPEPIRYEPFQSFKDLPDSMPYHGAFSANSEKVLVPHVSVISKQQKAIKDAFTGQDGLSDQMGDFSLVLCPLPKIALCYIFYLPDDEFPASATCLFSANALSFLPLDGLADVAEYTAREMIQLVGA